MARTTSLSFPQMFDCARNRVSVLDDMQSVSNRVKQLMLSRPSELYNEPKYGLGLDSHLWQYNTDNQIAILENNLKAQIRLFEPCVDPDSIVINKGLLYSGGTSSDVNQEYNELKLTVQMNTLFGDTITVSIDSQEVSYNG